MKRALVTGGSRGLGLAICRRLLTDGWRVVTASRQLSPGLANLMAANEGRLEHICLDFAEPASTRQLSEQARLLEGVDAFVANAAVGTEGLLTLTSERELRASLEINLLAPMLLTREVLKGMLACGGGSLVFISSVAARTGLSGLVSYSVAKGGLISFSRALAREYGERGIRSNVVLPGFLETEMSRSLSDEKRKQAARRTALKRLGQPDDIVGCVSFLLSDGAQWVTGAEFVVDGGMLA